MTHSRKTSAVWNSAVWHCRKCGKARETQQPTVKHIRSLDRSAEVWCLACREVTAHFEFSPTIPPAKPGTGNSNMAAKLAEIAEASNVATALEETEEANRQLAEFKEDFKVRSLEAAQKGHNRICSMAWTNRRTINGAKSWLESEGFIVNTGYLGGPERGVFLRIAWAKI